MPRARGQQRHNLPAPRTRLVGREQDGASVRETLLRHDGRLVTLTGAGGCGKTRLAFAAALDLLNDFEAGVWLVELAALADPSLVATAAATPFGVQNRPGRLVDTLAAYLRSRSVLIILDNCEHLIEAAAQLAGELLERCPTLWILATSRAPLRIAGEVIWSVPPLATPDPHRTYDPDELADYAAVRLFVDRVRASRRGFRLRQ